MSANPYPTINLLRQKTGPAWVEQTLAHVEVILVDHAHCELKAANNAINLMFRYPAYGELVVAMTAIAQEELEHFQQVSRILTRLGIAFGPLNSPPYAARLKQQIRTSGPERFLDSLLVGGLIEARSHERLGLLAAHLPSPELSAFYRGLMASEARHFGTFWTLADTYFDRALVQTRLHQLADYESEILTTLHPEPRIHS
jgi:tRNA 2-(methylsulfanyl)-N6-isopentenyladenosine37 hydroxylase